jgi:hypothetical protein
MALMHGKLGNVTWDAAAARQTLAYIQNWTCDISMDAAEITSMQDTWRTYLGGYRDWTATVTTLLPSDGTDISLSPGDPNGFADTEAYLELYLKYDATNTEWRMLFGEAICTGIEHGNDAQGIATSTYTFQGVSILAWDTESDALHSYA